MTKRRNKRASFALFAVLMLFLTGCSGQYYGGIAERTDGLEDAYTEDILPESQNTSYGSKVSATLYFRYLSEDLLAGVEQEFTVTAENTIEELVVQALIGGPQDTQYQFNALISPDTELVSVKEQSGYLSVTLSEKFLEKMSQSIESEEMRRRLAVQSIVNSITSIGNYSRVLILIDESGNGNGERLTYAEAGWEDKGERTIEPLSLDDSVILTPERVMEIVMRSVVEKDYERLGYYLAERDYDGQNCPSRSEYTELLSTKPSIVSFEMANPVITSGNGKHAAALLNLTYIDSGGHTVELNDLPVRMVYQDVWKVSFSSLNAMFPEN